MTFSDIVNDVDPTKSLFVRTIEQSVMGMCWDDDMHASL